MSDGRDGALEGAARLPWWEPLRSDRAVPTLGQHAAAVGLALLATLIIAISVISVSSVLQLVSPSGALWLNLFGYILAISVAFSWVGHIVGAGLLHFLLRRGLAGWAVVLLAGGLVGAVLSSVLATVLPMVLGPVLALLQLLALRRVMDRR